MDAICHWMLAWMLSSTGCCLEADFPLNKSPHGCCLLLDAVLYCMLSPKGCCLLEDAVLLRTSNLISLVMDAVFYRMLSCSGLPK